MAYPGTDRRGQRVLTLEAVARHFDERFLDGYRCVSRARGAAPGTAGSGLTPSVAPLCACRARSIYNVAAEVTYDPNLFHGRVEHIPVAAGDTATLATLAHAAKYARRGVGRADGAAVPGT